MANLNAAEPRPVKLEVLPDLRKRLTHFRLVDAGYNLKDSTVKAWGLLWSGPMDAAHGNAGFANLRLVDQFSQEPGDDNSPKGKLTWCEVYETIPATGEVQVGNYTQTQLEDGRAAAEGNFLQLSADTYAKGTPGAAATIAGATLYLQGETAVDAGAVRQIKRTYVAAGIISTDDESLQGGKLLKKTIVSVHTVPSTPGGYTLVGSPVQSPLGLPTYTYTFYKGDGEVGRTESSDNNGALQRVVIRHLTASGAGQPTTDTLTGGVIVTTEKVEQDGHLSWTVTWAKGLGTVSETSRSSQGGKIVTYRSSALGTPPAEPAPTIGGTVVLTVEDVRQDAGFTVYDYTWVEGLGELSRSVAYAQSSDQGTTGITRTTIRYAVEPGGDVLPGELDGSTSNGFSYTDEDGFRVWTTEWVKGTGTVTNETRTAEGGKVVIYHLVALGAAPSAPAATIGGTVTLTVNDVREADGFKIYDYTFVEGLGETARNTAYGQSSDQGTTGTTRTSIRYAVAPDGEMLPASLGGFVRVGESYSDDTGFRVWSTEWSKGIGAVFTKVSKENAGKLVRYTSVALGAAAEAPDPTIGGTVVLVDEEQRKEAGYDVFTTIWAEGKGVIRVGNQDRGLGLRLESWVSLGQDYDDTYMKPPGILMAKDSQDETGVTQWTVTCIQNSAGASPLVGGAVAEIDIINPGNVEYGSVPTITIGGDGTGATATAVLSGGSSGFLTSVTVTNGGSNFTYPPPVSISGGTSDVPSLAATLTGAASVRERFVKFTYPGRVKAVSLRHPDDSSSFGYKSVEAQLSPPIDADDIIGTEEISYRESASLSDLNYPKWSPNEWATLFAQFFTITGSNIALTSKLEGLRGYRTEGGVSKIAETVPNHGYVSMLGTLVGYCVPGSAPAKAYLTIFGGPDAPDGKTFTLEADVQLAFIDFAGTQYYRRTVVYATIPPQPATPSLDTVVMLSTAVNSLSDLKAVTTAGGTAVEGVRTSSFRHSWVVGGITFTRLVRPTLHVGTTLANDTTFYKKPTDYTGGTPKYWVLA